MLRLSLTLIGLGLAAVPALAQQDRGPFFVAVDGAAAVQGEVDLDTGGIMSVSRTFLRAGGLYRFGDAGSVGLFVSRGWIDYSFGDGATAPWSNVNDVSLSVALRRTSDAGVTYFVSPNLRYDFEDGADESDAQTYGAFVGASWRVGESLTIGPAFGVSSEIEGGSVSAFPALLIDWDITDRVNLSTGPSIGASQGPGLQLSYSYGENTTFGLASRFEQIRFRLDEDGSAPGGIGEDRSFPLVVTFDYAPNPGTGISAFAGAELGGRLRVEDTTGARVDEREYDPAPIVGAAFRLAF